jgi:putative oxidoreductase
MTRRSYFSGGAGAVGLLVLRLVVGAAFILHGWPKIQNATTWMNAFAGEKAPPGYLQAAAAISEFGGGIAWIIGFLTPLAAIGIAAVMATAIATAHLPAGDPFIAVNVRGQPYHPSFELAAAYLAAALCLLLTGPGALSLDYLLFGRRRSEPESPSMIRL